MILFLFFIGCNWFSEARQKAITLEGEEQACLDGDAVSCRRIGQHLMLGTGGRTKNSSLGIDYLGAACDKDDAKACKEIGLAFEFGKGLVKDPNKAVDYYTKACNLKSGSACHYLGTMYIYGRGVEVDQEIARSWFVKACELGLKGDCTPPAIPEEEPDF